MFMKLKNLAAAMFLAAGTAGALAAPRESFDCVAINGGPMIGTGNLGTGNSFVNFTATGGYNVKSLRLVGNVASWGGGTYGSETRMQVMSPGGTLVVFGPFSPLASTPPGPVAFDATVNIADQPAAGTWSVEPYETFNDAGDDATYDQVSVTLDDAIYVAPPPAFTDLGDRSTTGSTFNRTVTLTAPSNIQWFKIKLPTVTASEGWVDIWTTPTANPTPATDLTDTEIGLYKVDGSGATALWNDDDSGPGFWSMLSFGSTTSRGLSTFPGQADGLARQGQNGELTNGFYFVAVGRYNVTFGGTGFNVSSNATGTQTTTNLNFDISPPGTPIAPTATGAVSNTMAPPGESVVYTVTVTPGSNPASTGLSVHGNLTAVGGGSNVLFHDDGLNGDAGAGDLVYSYSYTIPSGASDGIYAIPVSVTDAQGRNGSASISGRVFVPVDLGQIGAGAGGSEVVTTHDAAVAGTGDIRWFRFSIGADVLQSSTNYLDIDTEPSAPDGTPTVGSINDTEIGAYALDGTLIADDDDSGSDYHSQLSFGDNANLRPAIGTGLAPDGRDGDLMTGSYYLAAGIYNVAFGASNLNVTGTGAAVGTFQVNFRTNIPGGGTGNLCGAADVGGVGGVAGADNHLDNNDFVVFIDLFFGHSPLADQGSTGGVAGSDSVWDNNDFVVFIDNFFTAPASCR